MIVLEDNTIHITRGDKTDNEHKLEFKYEDYMFNLDDKISFVVVNKKGYTKEEVLRVDKTIKEMGYMEPTNTIQIQLTSDDTKEFDLTNKKKTYWYDIVLNDERTLTGYDSTGAKKIIVYPGTEEV